MHRQRRGPWRGQQAPVVKLMLEDNLEPDTLPSQFESFAKDVVTFLNCLNEFPEFTDEAVNQSMRGFEADLKVCRVHRVHSCNFDTSVSSIGHRVLLNTRVSAGI